MTRAADILGLRRAGMAGLPVAVGAMAFVAAIAVAADGAARLVDGAFRAQGDRVRTALVPNPEPARMTAALAALRATPEVAAARALDAGEVGALLRPWLGPGAELGLGGLDTPGVIDITLRPDGSADPVAAALARVVAGASLADQDERLADVTRVLDGARTLADAVLAAIAAATAAVVAVATRAALLFRRETLEIAHGLGAERGFIAAELARLGAARAGAGAVCGVLVALPPVLALAWLAPALTGAPTPDWREFVARVPVATWAEWVAVPLLAAGIGRIVASTIARAWIGRLA